MFGIDDPGVGGMPDLEGGCDVVSPEYWRRARAAMLGCWRVACGRERRAIGRHAPQMLSRGGILPVCAGLYCIAGVRTSRLAVCRRRRRRRCLSRMSSKICPAPGSVLPAGRWRGTCGMQGSPYLIAELPSRPHCLELDFISSHHFHSLGARNYSLIYLLCLMDIDVGSTLAPRRRVYSSGSHTARRGQQGSAMPQVHVGETPPASTQALRSLFHR